MYVYRTTRDLTETLERKIQFLDPVAKDLVEKAMSLMMEVHATQRKRSSGIVFVDHTLKTALILIELTGKVDVDLVVAALLHDTVEDKAKKLAFMGLEKSLRRELKDDEAFRVGLGKNLEEAKEAAYLYLEDLFGKKVSWLVRQLTHPNLPRQDYEEMSESEKMLSYWRYFRESIENEEVFLIRLADVLNNLDHLRRAKKRFSRRDWLVERIGGTVTMLMVDLKNRRRDSVLDAQDTIRRLKNSLDAVRR